MDSSSFLLNFSENSLIVLLHLLTSDTKIFDSLLVHKLASYSDTTIRNLSHWMLIFLSDLFRTKQGSQWKQDFQTNQTISQFQCFPLKLKSRGEKGLIFNVIYFDKP